MEIQVEPINTEQPQEANAVEISAQENSQQDAGERLWSKRVAWLLFVVMSAVILVSIVHTPAPVKPNEEYFTICGFKNLTGLPCPGCGLTHSFCEIGKGHLASAFDFNWLGLPLFLLTVLIWLQTIFILTNSTTPAFALDRFAARVRPMRLFAIAFALYGVGRIVYILLYNPAARSGNPFAKLFSLIGG
jgi:hypothetical protein